MTKQQAPSELPDLADVIVDATGEALLHPRQAPSDPQGEAFISEMEKLGVKFVDATPKETPSDPWVKEFYNKFGNEGLFADKSWAGTQDEFERVLWFIRKVRAEAMAEERARLHEAVVALSKKRRREREARGLYLTPDSIELVTLTDLQELTDPK